MNSNDNLEYLEKLGSVDCVNFYHTFYDILIRNKENKLKFEEFDRFLEKYIKGLIPDYTSFYSEGFKLLSKDFKNKNDYNLISSFLDNINEPIDMSLIAFLTFNEYNYKMINKTLEDTNTINSIMKFKLLSGLYRHKEFTRINSILYNIFNQRNVKDLTYDVDKISPLERLSRLELAIQRNQKNYALELSASIIGNNIYDFGERIYFKGIIFYKDGNYKEALVNLNHEDINKDCIDYQAILDLRLLCYANLGDLDNYKLTFKEIIQYRKIGYYLGIYSLMVLYLNMSVKDYDRIDNKYFLGIGKYNFEDNSYYNEFASTLTSILEKIYNNLLEYKYAVNSTDDELVVNDFIKDIVNEKYYKSLLVGLLNVVDYSTRNNLEELFTLESFDKYSIEEYQRQFENIASILYINGSSALSNGLISYLKFIYKIDKKELFVKIVKEKLSELIDIASSSNQTEYNEILYLLYLEDDSIKELNEFVSNNFNDKNYEEDSKISKIKNCLSDKGKSTLIMAEREYKLSEKEDYGWKDAGILSFSFYKIIEVEFNNYIKLLFNKCTYDDIENIEVPKDNWKQNLKVLKVIYRKMNNLPLDDDISSVPPSLMLGNINFLLTKLNDNNDLARFINEKLREALSEKFDDVDYIIRLMKMYTNKEKIKKYRNPPAHAMYLKYDVAVECRNIVLDLFKDEIIPIMKR